MTSLADTPEDRASGLIWHGRYSEARELVEKMPEDSIRGHVINMYIAASIAIATGTVETYDAWKVSVNKVLEVCAEAKMFLTIQGLISGSQDFLAGKDEALKAAFQRMQATCKTFGKAPMFHWMTSQLARVSGNLNIQLHIF